MDLQKLLRERGNQDCLQEVATFFLILKRIG